MKGSDIRVPEIDAEDIETVNDNGFTEENCAIVTGAASGIGRATAIALAANGLTVVGTDIDIDGLREMKNKVTNLGLDGAVETVQADLTVDDDIEAIVKAANSVGQIRYLANIAGLQHIDPIDEFPPEKFDLMYQVMVRAPFHLSQLVIPHIAESENGKGCIGNMASVHGHYVTSDKVGYNTSKFAIRGLTQSIAAEGDGNIRSFSVSTGYVSTPLVVDQIPDTAKSKGITEQEVVEDVMLGQSRNTNMMDPIDVGNLFVIGFSNLASHLNGGDLMFDGGMTSTYQL